jgi:hypothetical protein
MRYNKNIQEEEMFYELCALTEDLCDLPRGAVGLKSRQQKYQVVRSAVSCVARMVDDIHQRVIAKGLNRDRSLIYHYEKMHMSNYKTWELYRETFDKIYNYYTEVKSKKKSFLDITHLKEYLTEQGVTHSDLHQQCIRIKSDNLTLDIISSYKDFFTKKELIKLALKDYNYTYELR